MALNAITTGDQIAAFVQSAKPVAGTAVTTAQLKFIWEGIMNIIYTDLAANANVAPGSFSTIVGGGPVTGIGGPIS